MWSAHSLLQHSSTGLEGEKGRGLWLGHLLCLLLGDNSSAIRWREKNRKREMAFPLLLRMSSSLCWFCQVYHGRFSHAGFLWGLCTSSRWRPHNHNSLMRETLLLPEFLTLPQFIWLCSPKAKRLSLPLWNPWEGVRRLAVKTLKHLVTLERVALETSCFQIWVLVTSFSATTKSPIRHLFTLFYFSKYFLSVK